MGVAMMMQQAAQMSSGGALLQPPADLDSVNLCNKMRRAKAEGNFKN